MVKCEDCENEMKSADTCNRRFIQFGDRFYTRITKNNGIDETTKRCHDCGILMKDGNIHHQGCDWEICPRCGGQQIACGCHGIWCDKSCGDWETNGCEKPHAGLTHVFIPDNLVMTPSESSIKENRGLNTQHLICGVENYGYEDELKRYRDKLGGGQIADLLTRMFELGKKHEHNTSKERRIREWQRLRG